MKSKILAVVFLMLFSSGAYSVVINVDQINTLGNTWQASYSVSNSTLANDIEALTIFYDFNLYENLSIIATPSNWDPLIIQPDKLIPDDGFYDVLALNDGIALGQTLSGFTVSFDWLGVNTPTAQNFQVIDPITFNTLAIGTSVISVVPEPSSFILMFLGLFALFFMRSYKRSWF